MQEAFCGVQFNRPTKRNAMTSAMYVALAGIFNEAANDENTRKPAAALRLHAKSGNAQIFFSFTQGRPDADISLRAIGRRPHTAKAEHWPTLRSSL